MESLKIFNNKLILGLTSIIFLLLIIFSYSKIKEYNILKNSSVAVCGLGGLGSNAAISLARAGVGSLKLIDFDIVEPSNINRQAYFIEHIGKNKTDALKEIINKISPYINIETANIYLDETNIINELSGLNVLIIFLLK